MSAEGYCFPPEWAPHAATWLSWPHNADTWPAGRLARVQHVFVSFIRLLAQAEDVHLHVLDEAQRQAVARQLEAAGVLMDRISLHLFPTNDAWCRDHGPCFVFDRETGRKTIVDWGFTSWGGKYPYALDTRIPSQVAAACGVPRMDPGFVLEGGSIDVNGGGCLLTTTSCLLHANRNPGRSQEEMEDLLRYYYGVEQILWLGDGIVGDDTDGHVDDITRFVAEDMVVTAVEPKASDPNYAPLQANLALLQQARLADGRPLRIVELPMPEPVVADGMRLPASYANFYIANAAVVVPTFGCPQDAVALDILRQCFTRPVVGLAARDIVYGLGAFHCLSQQEPVDSGEADGATG